MAKSPGPARPDASLSVERIVSVALDVLDERGLGDFSLRLVARRLGVTPMSLYYHVEDRDTVLSLVAERVMNDIEVPSASLEWPLRLREIAVRYRVAVRRHPHVAQLIAGSLASMSSGDLPLMEGMLAPLVEAGVPERRLIDAYNAFVGAMVGFVGLELAEPSNTEKWQERRERELAQLDSGELPVLLAHRKGLDHAFGTRAQSGMQDPMDSAFHLFLDIYLAGLRATLLSD